MIYHNDGHFEVEDSCPEIGIAYSDDPDSVRVPGDDLIGGFCWFHCHVE